MNQEYREKVKSRLGCVSVIMIVLVVATIVAITIAVSLSFGIAWGMTSLAVVLGIWTILFFLRVRKEVKELSELMADEMMEVLQDDGR